MNQAKAISETPLINLMIPKTNKKLILICILTISFICLTSPVNATSIIYQSDIDGSYNIYKSGIDGSYRVAIVSSQHHDNRPKVSNKLDQIVFSRKYTGSGNSLWIVGLDGVGEYQLTYPNGRDEDFDARWSSDDQFVTFSGYRPYGTGGQVMIVDSSGSNLKSLYYRWGYDSYPAGFIENDSKVAFFRNIRYWGGRALLMTVNVDGTQPTVIANIEQLTGYNGGVLRATVDPDGQVIVFSYEDINTKKPSLFKINIDGSGLEQLAISGDFSNWTTDKRIIYSDKNPISQKYELILMENDGTNKQVILADANHHFLCGNLIDTDQNIVVDPTEYDFGFVELFGESRTTTVTITNDGGSDLAVSDIKLVEYVDGDPYTNSYVEFGLVEPVPTVPVIIPPGGTQEVLVEYIPKYIYNWASLFHVAEAELVVTSDDPDEPEVRVAFSGKGAQDVDIDQGALDFVEDAGKLYNANMITLSDNGKSGGNKFNALLDTVLTAGSHIAEGNLTEACDLLWGAYKHIDGQDKPKDHIYGEGAIILANSIAEMMAEQACPQTP